MDTTLATAIVVCCLVGIGPIGDYMERAFKPRSGIARKLAAVTIGIVALSAFMIVFESVRVSLGIPFVPAG